LTTFGRWLRANGHDALSSLDMAATRAALQREASFVDDLESAAAKVKRQQMEERERLVQERKEQSILAALVFGCSCGSKWMDAPSVAEWLREHAHCAGLGAMVREDA